MVALKGADIDRFVAKPDRGKPVVLVYGPDTGLVRERAAALIKASVDDPNDQFMLARLEGDDVAGEPGRLVEEANTIPLFGGRRAVWVRASSRNIVPAVEALIANSSPDCRVVIEAGNLAKSAPLRVLCEKAKNAVTLPCFIDTEAALGRLIDDEMRAASLTISPEARTALLPLIGGDRLASRSEVQKLALFAHGKGKVELDDVLAVIADASALALDSLVDAVFAGRIAEVEFQFGKAQVAGTSPGAIISAAQRQVAVLHKARLAVDDGRSVDDVMQATYVHFSRKTAVEAALRIWSSPRLERAMTQLAEAAFEARKRTDMAQPIAHRALLSLAVNARRKE
jgi:DNA polymerase-3 subunit delta